MNFVEAVKTCLLEKYATFSGRAKRSEFWWFFLFLVGLSFAQLVLFAGAMITTVDFANLNTLRSFNFGFGFIIFLLIIIALWIPTLAAGSRRLHDTNRSGWWQILAFIPIVNMIGLIVVIVFWAMDSVDEGNRY